MDDAAGHAEELLALPYVEFSSALLAAQPGADLFETLSAEFPTIGRADVFFGIVIAWTQLQADLIISEAEARRLRRQLAERQAA